MLPKLSGECGAAFPLRLVADASQSLPCPSGTIFLRAGAPYASIVLDSPVPASEIRRVAWTALQEALDLHATRTRRPITTGSGERDVVTWIRTTHGYELRYLDIAESKWSVTATLSTGGAPPPPPPQPAHHPALRFYRLSQASNDLFDAYRNGYLALECLISGESPKGASEPELDWLIRVSKSNFAAAIPGGVNIDASLSAIYKTGRLPLFHAKQSATFFTPQGEERQLIQRLLEDLTFLLVSFFKHKLGNDAVASWGSMSQTIYDSQAKLTLDCDALVIKHRWLRRTLPPSVTVHGTPRRFDNLWGEITVNSLPGWIPALSRVETRMKGKRWLMLKLLEPVPLSGVSSLTLELQLISRHASAPSPLRAS